MSTDYQTIIDALDAEISTGISRQVTFSVMGRTYTYHSLTELVNAREYFQKKLDGVTAAANPIGKVKFLKIKSAGA
ncbi:MAG: hypothetical protein GY839_11920 [candidate division Zixibacteria bacterium]|nr:hypothetical protein [candidate division Zixibacteria bacterium]